jgi:catechol 2,3-dioxygenase-like lactoylglutathione lyase family enzyme
VKPRITVLTLGVSDLDASLAFYRDGLGLATPGIVGREFEHGAVAFFELKGGLVLALWPRDDLAWDAGLPRDGWGKGAVSIGHNVASKREVDDVIEQARRAGARVVKPGEDTFWGGYAGYFRDPDDHLWEVAWNPQLELEE